MGFSACAEEGKCVRKDDMAEILEKMIKADAIVLSVPVYFYAMCAQMKTLIDRTVARYTEITDKDFYFIVTAADEDRKALDRTIEEFRGFISCLNGAKEKGIIHGTGAWKAGDIMRSPAMEHANEDGEKSIAESIARESKPQGIPAREVPKHESFG